MTVSDRKKAVFLDRDGVINRERGDYTWLLEDFVLNEGLVEALCALQRSGYMLIVISNQSGISKGIYSRDQVEYLHAQLTRNLKNKGVVLEEIYYCPHHPDFSKCICRKPDSLMIEKAVARFNIDKDSSWFIGDAQRDMDAAVRAGVRAIRVVANEPLDKVVSQIAG
ncbi:MAG: D-glycero-alpha-D-manno-heptose-1,7-bisphosphate 7-phosphatase [Bacteroidota bacterium]